MRNKQSVMQRLAPGFAAGVSGATAAGLMGYGSTAAGTGLASTGGTLLAGAALPMAAATAGAGLVGYGAYKLGRAAYNKIQGKTPSRNVRKSPPSFRGRQVNTRRK